jgi:hypothetical protein
MSKTLHFPQDLLIIEAIGGSSAAGDETTESGMIDRPFRERRADDAEAAIEMR